MRKPFILSPLSILRINSAKDLLFRYKEFIFLFSCSGGLLGLGWILAYVKLRSVEGPLILHWSEYTGINQIGSLRDLSLVALTGLIIWAVNLALAFALKPREPFLAKIMALGTLFMAALLFLALMAIISVNT